MAVGSFTLYSNALQEMTTGSFDLPVDNYRMVLMGNTYVPQPNVDTNWGDISAAELPSNGGYTQGGILIQNMTSTQSDGVVTVTCNPVVWSAFTAMFYYAVIVRQAGVALVASDLLLCYFSTNGGIGGDGGLMTVTPSASGLFTITHTP